MQRHCNRALKEWDVACRALIQGKQTILIRKGGIREDGGQFVINDSEFWLMPTFDHQSACLLQPAYAAEIAIPSINKTDKTTVPPGLGVRGPTSFPASSHNPDRTAIQGYAVVDQVWVAKDDEQVNALRHEMIWNEEYVKLRFDFNPYDPLYIILLRVYRLAEPVVLPMIKAYGGCKSWVTLEQSISTAGVIPVISDSEFAARSNHIWALLSLEHMIS